MGSGFLLALLLGPAAAALPSAEPAAVGMDAGRLAVIDGVAKSAIDGGKTPGAVVLVVCSGKVVYRKAFGRRALRPEEEAMTVDTVFDLASLTKPVATAASVAILVRRGKLRVEDPVGTYLPAFTGGGKEKVTLAHLLLHTSGLPAGNPVADYAGGRTAALEKLCALKLAAAPGERFVYSDLGYILLGEVVEKVSGQRLDAFAAKNVFEPLGMKETSFAPLDAKRLARTAPTERVGGKYLRGTVHDPRARRLGGVAGHAGLFGTADDLAVFAQALLDGGRGVFTTADVDFLTRPRKVPGGERTYGFDARTAYSGNRGKLFAGFGHTGFTGTSLWVDPGSRTAVIVLTNRVHPDGKGDVRRLRAEVATLAARAVVRPPPGKR